MRDEPGATENSALGLGDTPAWRVVEVQPLPGSRLAVLFADGTRGEVDLSRLIAGRRAGVFAALANATLFAQVYVDHGAVSWPGDIDLAPDAMYDEIRANGTWIVE
jgi:hypothetical protein